MPSPPRRNVKSVAKALPTIDDVVAEPEKNWNALYLKSQIADAEDALSLQESWQSFTRVATFFGLVALWGAAVSADFFGWPSLGRWNWILYVSALMLSLVLPTIGYRQHKRVRGLKLGIKKTKILLRDKLAEQDRVAGRSSDGPLVKQRRYRDDIPDIVAQMREQAARLRRIHNRYQAVIIVGSILASAITTASVSFEFTRWISVVVTALVGLAAGFTGYYKFHDNSYNLQQASDAIEREYESVDLRVGRYSGLEDKEAYSMFADTVERMRDEQNKRQQQLDQPVEATSREQAPTTS
ncbi:DUF4231 domain-containing protein [Actinoplanes rectilineatus]|uniref:DUF4231 domain-containing protein n=1 Tax=Actinoplanes rectilineatus TaxID=113571 RepID=UPI000A5B85F0|nr:DUF4231 domain-containing protein [Actinoplanes rectilineatus]